MTGNIFNIQRFSLFDGPGVRTVVFLKGCPLRCIWCHNPEGLHTSSQIMYTAKKCIGCGECVKVCKNKAHKLSDGFHGYNRQLCTVCGECTEVCCSEALSLVGKRMNVDDVISEILRDSPFYRESGGGATLSGGEPLLQAEFAIEILKRLKALGISTCIETSGMAEPSALILAAEYTDFFYYDYKATGDEMHKRLCGAAQRPVLENLARLDGIGAHVTLRCPIIPDANECEEHILGIAQTAKKYSCIREVHLEPFHRLGISKAEKLGMERVYDTMPPSRADMEAYRDRIQKVSGKKCIVN